MRKEVTGRFSTVKDLVEYLKQQCQQTRVTVADLARDVQLPNGTVYGILKRNGIDPRDITRPERPKHRADTEAHIQAALRYQADHPEATMREVMDAVRCGQWPVQQARYRLGGDYEKQGRGWVSKVQEKARARVRAFLNKHPNASHKEVKMALPGVTDGQIRRVMCEIAGERRSQRREAPDLKPTTKINPLTMRWA